MAEDLKFAVTHFYRRSPNNRGWIQTDFITRIVGAKEDFHYPGIPKVVKRNTGEGGTEENKVLTSPIDWQKIKLDILNGSLIELGAERIIDKSEAIWIASDQSVYIANAYDPSKSRKEQIYIDNISNIYSVINYTVRRLLNSDNHENLEAVLKPYMSNEYWNILLSIILKDLIGNRITQSNLERIGFVFPELDRIYGYAFTLFMNEHKVAYTNDGLVRFQRDFEFLTWSIHKVAGAEKDEIYLKLAGLNMFKRAQPYIKVIPTREVHLEEEYV